MTKLGIVAGLVGVLLLSAANPTLARTIRTAAITNKISYNSTCEAYWLARGFILSARGGDQDARR